MFRMTPRHATPRQPRPLSPLPNAPTKTLVTAGRVLSEEVRVCVCVHTGRRKGQKDPWCWLFVYT
jgi:hypothetical protein